MKNLSHKLLYFTLCILCIGIIIASICLAEGKTRLLSIAIMVAILVYPLIYTLCAFLALCFGKKVYGKIISKIVSGNIMTTVGYDTHIYFKHLKTNKKLKTTSTIFSVDTSKGVIVLRKFLFVYIYDKFSTSNLDLQNNKECIEQLKKIDKFSKEIKVENVIKKF